MGKMDGMMDDTVRVVGERRASRMARNHYLQTRLGESGYPARLVGLKGKLMKYNGQLVWPTTYDNGSLSGFVVNVKEMKCLCQSCAGPQNNSTI